MSDDVVNAKPIHLDNMQNWKLFIYSLQHLYFDRQLNFLLQLIKQHLICYIDIFQIMVSVWEFVDTKVKIVAGGVAMLGCMQGFPFQNGRRFENRSRRVE